MGRGLFGVVGLGPAQVGFQEALEVGLARSFVGAFDAASDVGGLDAALAFACRFDLLDQVDLLELELFEALDSAGDVLDCFGDDGACHGVVCSCVSVQWIRMGGRSGVSRL